MGCCCSSKIYETYANVTELLKPLDTGVDDTKYDDTDNNANEVYIDVFQSNNVNVYITNNGDDIKKNVKKQGFIRVKCGLQGTPVMRFGINDFASMESRRKARGSSRKQPKHGTFDMINPVLSPKCNQEKFDEDRTIICVPPKNGEEFIILKYDLKDDIIGTPYDITLKQDYNIDTKELKVKVSCQPNIMFKIEGMKIPENPLHILITAPKILDKNNISTDNSIFKGEWEVDNKLLIWKVKEITNLETFTGDFTINDINDREYSEWIDNGVNIKTIHGVTPHVCKVRFCNVQEPKFNSKVQKWVRYAEAHDDYTFHFNKYLE